MTTTVVVVTTAEETMEAEASRLQPSRLAESHRLEPHLLEVWEQSISLPVWKSSTHTRIVHSPFSSRNSHLLTQCFLTLQSRRVLPEDVAAKQTSDANRPSKTASQLGYEH